MSNPGMKFMALGAVLMVIGISMAIMLGGNIGTAAIGWAVTLAGAVLAGVGFTQRGGAANPGSASASAENLPKTKDTDVLRTVVNAMVAMASADGSVDKEEFRKIDEIYMRLTGRTIGPDAVGQIAYQFLGDKISIMTLLENQRDHLSAQDKTLIIKASYLIKMADDVADEGEIKRLAEIAQAIGVSEDEMQAIIAELDAG